MNDDHKSSYAQILKSSAIVGGAQAIEIIIRTVRVKLIAILLGPSGVGLIGLFQSTTEFVLKLSSLGISSSAVRQVAEANGCHDQGRLAITVKVLIRGCLVTGLLGWLLCIALSKPLSIWTFGNEKRVLDFVFLGSVIFITAFYEGQKAILQGCRRIEDLARVMVYSAIVGTVFSVALYSWLGEQGILIALPATAAVNWMFSWRFAHRLVIPRVALAWRATFNEAKPMITLGIAFMWAGILNTGVAFMTRSLVIRDLGIDAGGIYQAAWGISGLFAGFILNAMGKDFYPRLTAVAKDNDRVNRFVNEQIEIGLLIALPGLLATVAFSPFVIKLFYTDKFIQASFMLPWFVVGVFGRVISWPIGFVQLAKGASISFAITETVSNLLHLLLVWLGLSYFGLNGVAIAFATLYLFHIILVYIFAWRLSGYHWSKTVLSLICFSMLFIGLETYIFRSFSGWAGIFISLTLICSSGLFFLRHLMSRLDNNHRLYRLLKKVPLLSRIIFK